MPAQPPIDAIVRAIVERLAPRRIVLFGSRARGDADDDSDIDLMVELDGPADRQVRVERAESDIRMIDSAVEGGIAGGDSVCFLARQVAERSLMNSRLRRLSLLPTSGIPSRR